MTETVLVAGGAGFIGSHLCRLLLNEGLTVLCLDNCSSGKKENIHELLTHSRFEFIRQDVTKPLQLEVQQIYNLACPASPTNYQRDPVQTVKANVIGSINLLDLAKSNGARILQASTSEVYGDPEVHPQPENYWGKVNPVGVRSCYDEGKRCAETLFSDYHREFGLDIRIARIFNTYGPMMQANDGRVISNFIVQALSGSKLSVFGDGTQTRSFCYVSDMVQGLFKLMNVDTSKHTCSPVNLGNPDERTILDIAVLINKLTGNILEVNQQTLPSDDPKKRKPDISKARKLLDWVPEVGLEIGLKETILSFSSEFSVATE